ncbi:MAG: class I SAM-dependent methyltransferase [Oscillatoria sp. PMC 1068.18]|nr:class I SAM-dependent methyltransferase [Oscillatoria sp. PMC 1076.18]MEC4991319.1 class I SAM-dependent methyltransferase [Oscillatoria sp. PMC 1068.18]
MVENQPENSESRPWLSWICDSQDSEQLKKKYDSWANTYDTDVGEDWSFMPENAAIALERVLPAKDAKILDAGAGTGFVGESLAKLGYTNITAAELSEGMLEVARQKQVYKTLLQCNLEETDAFSEKEIFDAIISVGVFAHAHAGVRVLQNLFSLLKKGGFFVLTMRGEYRDIMQEALDRLPWSLVNQDDFGIYGKEVIYVLVFRKERSL